MSQWPSEVAVRGQFDHFAPRHDQLLQDPLRSIFASDPLHFYRRKWHVLDRLLRRTRRRPELTAWLDVGCGRGEFLEVAGPHFAVAAGCDPSYGMLSSPLPDFPVHKQQQPTSLPFPSHSFDFITAVCVFHHVSPSQRRALINDIRRVLRPGGLFCLIEHNPYNPVTRRIVNRCPIDADAELLTLRTASRLVTESGFRPVASEFFLYVPERWYQHFSPIEGVLRTVPLGGQYALLADAPC